MDEQFTIHRSGGVAIAGDSIVARRAGRARRSTRRRPSTAAGRVVMPGLVNAHTHVPMSLLRGLADDLRLDVWLMGYMMPVEREFVSPEFVRLGTQLGCAEMIRSGITCFADMYYFEDAVAEATADVGMRALCAARRCCASPRPMRAATKKAWRAPASSSRRWKGHPLIVPAPAPHAPYTCTPEILRSCAELAAEFDVPLHIHLSETLLEVEESRERHGMPGVPYIRKQGLFDAKVLAAHCVHVDDGEIRALKNFSAGVAHNPSSNLKLAAGVAPVARMLELGVNVGIGTDGAASNNDLDMFEETRLAALLAKGIERRSDRRSGARRAGDGDAARRGGAAHGPPDRLARAGQARRPDRARLSRLHNLPAFARDPAGIYARIVYTSKSTDVVDVHVQRPVADARPRAADAWTRPS